MHFSVNPIGRARARTLPWFRDEEQDLEPLLRANTAPGAVRSEVQREGNELLEQPALLSRSRRTRSKSRMRGKCCELRTG
jgi:hypothetical protein